MRAKQQTAETPEIPGVGFCRTTNDKGRVS
jgi:hypothetical protein